MGGFANNNAPVAGGSNLTPVQNDVYAIYNSEEAQAAESGLAVADVSREHSGGLLY